MSKAPRKIGGDRERIAARANAKAKRPFVKNAGRKMSKAEAYLNRVSTIEYDLHGAINAYGVDFVHWLIDEIVAGRVNCKQTVDRWAADKHLHAFSAMVSTYKSEGVYMTEEDDLPAFAA